MLARLKTFTLLFFAAVATSACSSDDNTPAAPTQNIAQTVQSQAKTDSDTSGFSILLAAVNAADPSVSAALTGNNKITLFAPTNGAFGAVLSELNLTRDQLFANRALLTQVLTYHVVSAEVRRAQVPVGKAIGSVEGSFFKVDSIANELVIVDERNRNAKLTQTDLAATNGVIHVIDKVILPGDQTVVAAASSIPDFSTLVSAVQAAGLVDALNGPGPLTVFAPTNSAFEAALSELGLTQSELLGNTALLQKILQYHVVGGTKPLLKGDVPVGAPITTLQGETLTVDSTLTITDQRSRKAKITATDTFVGNGVIHTIDKVILPRP